MRGRWPAWIAPEAATVDLLSDVHLDAAMPRTLAALAAHLLHTPAKQVLILGDLFEAWVGDDARHDGFERDCVTMLAAAASQRQLAFLPGNRDFLVGHELMQACGITLLPDPVLLLHAGRRTLLSHGDALCLGDIDYQRFRAQVRTQAWQRDFLARPLAERRAEVLAMRQASQAHQAAQGPDEWADVDAGAALALLRTADAPLLVHGHTHRPGAVALDASHQRWVLGDWDFDNPQPRARALRSTPQGWQWLNLDTLSLDAS